jgi:hypothetical protein
LAPIFDNLTEISLPDQGISDHGGVLETLSRNVKVELLDLSRNEITLGKGQE